MVKIYEAGKECCADSTLSRVCVYMFASQSLQIPRTILCTREKSKTSDNKFFKCYEEVDSLSLSSSLLCMHFGWTSESDIPFVSPSPPSARFSFYNFNITHTYVHKLNKWHNYLLHSHIRVFSVILKMEGSRLCGVRDERESLSVADKRREGCLQEIIEHEVKIRWIFK